MSLKTLLAAAVAIALPSLALAQTGTLRLVSHAYNNNQLAAHGADPVISANGRFVAFRSTATNLVGHDGALEPDTNNLPDVFVYDLVEGTAARVSLTSSGAEANGIIEGRPAISGDGRYVAFATRAPNLVNTGLSSPAPANHNQIVMVDRLTNSVTLITRTPNRTQAGDGTSSNPTFSADGRWLSFDSTARNLVTDPNLGIQNVFRYRVVGEIGGQKGNGISLASRDFQGNPPLGDGGSFPELNADGSRIVFHAGSTRMIDPPTLWSAAHAYSRDLGTTTPVQAANLLLDRDNVSGDVAVSSANYITSISGSGRFSAFSTEAKNIWPNMEPAVSTPSEESPQVERRRHLFLHDLHSKRISIVSLYPNGQTGRVATHYPALSQNDGWLAFVAHQWPLPLQPSDPPVGVYRRNLSTGADEWLNQPLVPRSINADDSGRPSISGDGQRVVFHSAYGDLVANTVPVNATMVYLSDSSVVQPD
ncbi:TolB family protein [Lysobacter silvisoli]|uniref:Uncharacterized protein n=1 Tax=Lysobacter silvisoli TaxID=2293254 RepID=A0A371K1M0_9GAMM|nr:PD40 domain-containing protein [Lysobacter silvisoli]RDZ27829.1 hypothetical protein DX914_01280 [Lysobacter silvisoli]